MSMVTFVQDSQSVSHWLVSKRQSIVGSGYKAVSQFIIQFQTVMPLMGTWKSQTYKSLIIAERMFMYSVIE